MSDVSEDELRGLVEKWRSTLSEVDDYWIAKNECADELEELITNE